MPSVIVPAAPLHAEYSRSLETVWSYLRGVGSENPERARGLLRHILEEAQKILKSLEGPSAVPVTPAADEANPDLVLAEEALRCGNLEEAIDLAHRAYERDSENPSLFRRMVEIHIEAANATSGSPIFE
jgi:hypothetical protein